MRPKFGDQRGGVMVLAAVMIPVFLLLTALVIDVGNWYTHDRQLQNRADAAALAAGVEYAQNWKGCVYEGSDPARLALKLQTAQKIANAARQYAADPEDADYALLDPSGTKPASLYNDQIARQSANQANNFLDVVVNSANNDYTDDTDYTDDYDANAATPAHPCFDHPTDPEGLSAPGHWTDVKVTERDTAALWEPFSPDLHARARVEIRPAISGRKFLPLAIPDNVITKVQLRYFDQCQSPGPNGTPLAILDLKPLPEADQGPYTALGGGSLWALPNVSDPQVGDKNRPFDLPVQPYSAADCGSLPYRPIAVQVRLTSIDSVDINGSCAALVTAPFADCFTRLSQIRIHETGSAEPEPRTTNVVLTGGCGSTGDAYFGTIPVTANPQQCAFGASVEVNWGSRDDGNKNISANFTVNVNGVDLNPPSPTQPSGIWTTAGTPLLASPGPNTVTVELDWEDNDPTHVWGSACRNGGQNPCKWNGAAEPAHQAFAGTRATSGSVELVRSSVSPFVSGLPGAPFDNSPGGVDACPYASPCQVYPTVGIKSVLKTGTLVTLRLDDPQANQTLRCDPNYAQGQEFSSFRFGCNPWYGRNLQMINNVDAGSPDWWNTSTKKCPARSQFFDYNDLGNGFGTNSSVNPWRCVPTAPGLSPPVIGEGLSVATENCSNINNNSCQQTSCLVEGNYDGDDGSTVPPWLIQSDSGNPRVVKLFIIPYQALKGAGGGDPEETVPILGFAAFYVMNWTGSNNGNSDPCPDSTWGENPGTDIPLADPPAGSATGVFVEVVEYETGPVDPNAKCVEGQLTPCRASFVR
jgi:hypothetical protein